MRSSLFGFAAIAVLSTSIALGGCAADSSEGEAMPTANGEEAFSSALATLLDFEFDARLVTDFSFNDKKTIQDQLLYTIGDLNQHQSVGRLDALVISDIQKSNVGGRTELRYHAKLPVAWGSKTNLPRTYALTLPLDVSGGGQEAFANAHADTCIGSGAHDVSADNMWYHWRPGAFRCRLGASEVIKVTATATVSTLNTNGIYPELHKVWEDNRLEAISIFGKNEIGGGADDPGIAGFNGFIRKMKEQLRGQSVVVTPASAGASPAPPLNDVTIEGTLADGKKVKVTALLVDAITSVWPGFDERYESLTPTADLIMYNGHAGLGQNVRALARKGRWARAKYQIFFINGCDTFAYVDGSLAQARASINGDDPTGSKYMEFVTNAMPSFFASNSAADMAIVGGLLSTSQPKTYQQMFQGIDRAEVVLVTGEEDNVYRPGMKLGSN